MSLLVAAVDQGRTGTYPGQPVVKACLKSYFPKLSGNIFVSWVFH